MKPAAASTQEARGVRFALPALLLLVAACLLPARADADAPAQGGAKAQQRRPFPHRGHVPDTWYYRGGKYPGDPKPSQDPGDVAEVARDCRGCHDFGARGADGKPGREARSPMAVCKNCHYGEVLSIEVQPGFERGLREGRGSSSAFEHLDHDNLACRQCHAQSPTDPDSFEGATGMPSCVVCHTEGGEERPYEALAGRTIDKQKIRAGFLEWLDKDASMSAPGRGPYPHDLHLPAERRDDAASCASCHGDVGAATALDLHMKEFRVQDCARCHVQKDGRPVQVEKAVETRASPTALSFSHADHLKGVASKDAPDRVGPGAQDRIDTHGCLECHERSEHPAVAADGSAAPPTYAVRADRDEYQDCMSCHDVAAFRAPHHGQWTSCAACHALEGGTHAAFKARRPTAAVDRLPAGAARFVVLSQNHPGVSGSVDQDCAACHRAPLRELPSRVSGARFEHASHLGPQPTAQDCLACHKDAAASADPSGIGLAWDPARAEAAPLESRASFEMTGCAACHPGIRLDPRGAPQSARRETVVFGHAAHMRKAVDPRTGKPVSCTSCHDFDAQARGAAMGVRAEALACTQCHAHDDAHMAATGGVGAAEAASCVRCHKDALPPFDAPAQVQRVRIALQGAQHHPLDKGCFDCHLQEPPGRLAAVTAVLASFPGGMQQHKDGRPSGCADCHWAKAPPGFPEAVVDGRTRAQAGRSLAGFPGQAGTR